MRILTSIHIEKDVLQQAKALGLNISRFTETKLSEFVKTQQNAILGGVAACGGPDLNRRTPIGTDLESVVNSQLPAYATFKKEYERYIKLKGLNQRYMHDLTRNLPHLITSPVSSPQELINIIGENKYSGALIRNYINFLESNQYIHQEVARKFKAVIPRRKTGVDNYVPIDNTIVEAFRHLQSERDKIVFKLLMFSGIRISEAIKMLTEFDESKLTVNEKFMKYSLSWDRGNKRVSYVYLPISMKNELHRFYLTHKIVGSLQKSGLSPKYLRKWFYNFAIYNGVPESVADYIEGRAGSTVGSLHYLARTQQADFWYQKLVEKLENILR